MEDNFPKRPPEAPSPEQDEFWNRIRRKLTATLRQKFGLNWHDADDRAMTILHRLLQRRKKNGNWDFVKNSVDALLHPAAKNAAADHGRAERRRRTTRHIDSRSDVPDVNDLQSRDADTVEKVVKAELLRLLNSAAANVLTDVAYAELILHVMNYSGVEIAKLLHFKLIPKGDRKLTLSAQTASEEDIAFEKCVLKLFRSAKIDHLNAKCKSLLEAPCASEEKKIRSKKGVVNRRIEESICKLRAEAQRTGFLGDSTSK